MGYGYGCARKEIRQVRDSEERTSDGKRSAGNGSIHVCFHPVAILIERLQVETFSGRELNTLVVSLPPSIPYSSWLILPYLLP